MKLSLNWVKEFTEVKLPVDKLVDKIGAQLGQVEGVTNLQDKYKGIYVVKVVDCVKHPNADKLKVCFVDDGQVVKDARRNKDGLVQVVCGANNVEAGLSVAWLPPGSVVPSSFEKDPFTLEAREIRGQVSNGMLASPMELAFGEDHDGILIIEDNVQPGTPLADVYGLDDHIIDIENKMFTHRPDAFGMLGLAREVAGISGQAFNSPDWYLNRPSFSSAEERLKINFTNNLSDLVPRYMLIPVDNIEVKQSPIWLRSMLSRLGVRPINNIVDITNYIMLLTAQPLHAYDYDKLLALGSGGKVEISTRNPKPGEKFEVLGGKLLAPPASSILITANDQPIGLGGVIGGNTSGVDSTTKRIILEAATFDMYNVRRTAMELGLFTDAATRFTKGQSPLQNDRALVRALELIDDLAAGNVAGPAIDSKSLSDKVHDSALSLSGPLVISVDFINSRLGLNLSKDEIKKILENVEFSVFDEGKDLTVVAPFWRTDIEITEDVMEEVGRLYGYDRLPLNLPSRTIAPTKVDPTLSLKSEIRELLKRAGGNEVLTYSFVHSSLLTVSDQKVDDAYHIRNAISPDLQYYRLSLVPSLISKVHQNIKAGFDKFAIYEFGRAHVRGVNDDEELPTELQRLSVVTAARRSENSSAAFYQARAYTDFVLTNLGIADVQYKPLDNLDGLPKDWQVAASAFDENRRAAVYSADNFLGIIGEPTTKLRTKLKLPTYTSQIELSILALQEQIPTTKAYQPLNKFPETEQDICLKLNQKISYAEVTTLLTRQLSIASAKKGYIFDIKPLDIYQQPNDQEYRQMTWRVTLSHPSKTLTTNEVNSLFGIIAKEAKTALNAERI